MAIIEIPLDESLIAYKFRIDLDGITYTLDLDFNSRSQRWRLSIKDDTEVDIVTGIVLLPKLDLLKYHRYNKALPQGILALFNLEDENTPPIQGELGSKSILLYEEAI